jgi:Uncharacterized alpha/beta hydrolase domain (DUF2235)
MKRIVVLIDGTWNKEGTTGNTNVAALDPGNRIVAHAFIKTTASDGAAQHVHYHDGVGVEGDLFKKLLGGAIGLGLKQIIRECYDDVVDDYTLGDEIYLIGFSRGAYAARALAGLIGASGIQRSTDAAMFETAWRHYRVKPAARAHPEMASSSERTAIADYGAAGPAFHDARAVKCVGVWDTVGSNGIPAGLGLAPLARYFALLTLGFHDTSFGDHVEVGLHGVGVDEHRRPFVPTFWTIPRGQRPKGHVEQIWFAGAHYNVGGGYPDAGLSDQALVWMIARLQALTGLEFDIDAVKAGTRPNIRAAVVDSTKGWPIDHTFPHYRKVLSPDAIHHGYLSNIADPTEEHINERIRWSVIAKHQEQTTSLYDPPNLPAHIPAEKIASLTDQERQLLEREN